MENKKRWVRIALFVAYCIFIIWYTLLKRKPTNTHDFDFRFMWAYRELIAGSSTGKADVLQNVGNIIFFIPFGFLFPSRKWISVIIFALPFSVFIETAQYIFGLGLCELDDMICNTLGAMVGFVLYIVLLRLLGEKRKWKKS